MIMHHLNATRGTIYRWTKIVTRDKELSYRLIIAIVNHKGNEIIKGHIQIL